MKKSILLILLISCSSINAQPVLSTAITPAIGQTVNQYLHDSTGVMPGPAGVNQTWTINLTPGTLQSFTYNSATGTPYASSFPNAGTAALLSGTYIYYETLPGYFDYYGYSNGSSQMIYSDPETMLVGPFSYQDLSQDICSGSFSYSTGVSGTRTGTTDKFYDAYGTLVLNGIIHNNVARIFIEQNFTDSSNNGTQIRHVENFLWFDGNTMAKLLEMNIEYNSNNVVVNKIAYSYTVSTALSENNPSDDFQICSSFENSGKFNLQFNTSKKKNLNLEIYNLNGALLQKNYIQSNPGMNNFEFSMNQHPVGMYFLSVSEENSGICKSVKFIHH